MGRKKGFKRILSLVIILTMMISGLSNAAPMAWAAESAKSAENAENVQAENKEAAETTPSTETKEAVTETEGGETSLPEAPGRTEEVTETEAKKPGSEVSTETSSEGTTEDGKTDADDEAKATDAAEVETESEVESSEEEAADVEVDNGAVIGDDYPNEYPGYYKTSAIDSVIDRWNFYNRECTSFAAWRLNSANGVGFTNQYLNPRCNDGTESQNRWGHAKHWGCAARTVGIRVDNTPAVGSIWWSNAGTYGHVAWVADVNGTQVTIEEYNYGYTGNYGTRVLPASSATGYIHIKDIPVPDPKPTLNPRNLGNNFYAYIRYAVNGTYVESENGGNNVQTSSTDANDYPYYEPRQIWHFEYAMQDRKGASYTISNAYGILDAFGGGQNGNYTETRNVGIFSQNNLHNNQRWYIDDIGGGKYRIVPVYSYEDDNTPALFLDPGTASTTDKGKQVRNISVCPVASGDWAFAQQFSIDKIDNYATPITNFGDDFYAYIAFGNSYIEAQKTAQGSIYNVQISAPASLPLQPSYEPKQIWHFVKDKSGKSEFKDSYKIVNAYNDECLDAAGQYQNLETNIQAWVDNGQPSERWYLVRSGNGYNLVPTYCYRTKNYAMGLVLDVSGVVTTGGNNVQLWYKNGTAAQNFKVQKLTAFSSDSQLTSYQKPVPPAAPSTFTISSRPIGTDISWNAVPAAGNFDSREYLLDIYSGNTASGTPVKTVRTTATSRFFSFDELPRGEYTLSIRSANIKYTNLVSAPATHSFKAGSAIELGFVNAGDQLINNGKMELKITYNETASRAVRLVAASYTASGKMQASAALSCTLANGENKVAIPAASLASGACVKVYCLDSASLAPLTDNIVYSGKNSEWVLASQAPPGATILDEKWSYTETKTETTTSTSSSMAGWTRTGTTLQQTGTGAYYYASYPGGFYTGHPLYNAYNKSALASINTDTSKRIVSGSEWQNYIYWHWTHNNAVRGNGNYNVYINPVSCWEGGYNYQYFSAFESTEGAGHIDATGRNGGDCFYVWHNNPAEGSWWWFAFSVYRQTYTDYRKIYSYEKKTATNLESKTQPAQSATISNLKHWVKYSQ